MLGIEGAIDLVLARLETQMPAKVVEVANRFPSDTTTLLREPQTYAASLYSRVEPGQYPIIEVAPRNDGPPTFRDQYGDVWTYEWPYAVRVYLIERGASFQQVEARRQRLTLAIREVLTSSPQLQADPAAWIDTTTMRSAYFGIDQLAQGDNRSIAATSTDLVVNVQEMTEPYQPSTAHADHIVVAVSDEFPDGR